MFTLLYKRYSPLISPFHVFNILTKSFTLLFIYIYKVFWEEVHMRTAKLDLYTNVERSYCTFGSQWFPQELFNNYSEENSGNPPKHTHSLFKIWVNHELSDLRTNRDPFLQHFFWYFWKVRSQTLETGTIF